MVSRTARMIGRTVGLCVDHARAVTAGALLLWVLAIFYAVSHFAMTTDTKELLSPNLPWRRAEQAFERAFPQQGNTIVAVVEGATPELAEDAAARLSGALARRPDLFPAVDRPDGGEFFQKNGLLFLKTPEVKDRMDQLIKAQPFLGPMAADPSLRGVMTSLSTVAEGVSNGDAKLDDVRRPVRQLADALERVEAGQPEYFSWRAMISGAPPERTELRRLIVIHPKLNFARLRPGADASAAIRATAAELHIDAEHGQRVRLTGQIPLQDEEFGSLAEHVEVITTLMLVAILLMIWFAVRSVRVVLAVILVTLMGLTVAADLGLLAFGRFNVISVAFIPLFVGLGVDFGIQVSVRYRTEQLAHAGNREALEATGEGMGRSLVLAAAAIAAGFLSFAPTSYRGLSELGVIAGGGMLIALVLNLTVLPAVISLLRPPPRASETTVALAARLDRFVLKHRREVLIGTAAVALCGLLLTPFARFDFNPLHLRSPKVESMQALTDLMADPDQSPNTIDVLAPSLAAAQPHAARLKALPEVSKAVTLASFVPGDQAPKLALIADAQLLLDPTLNPFFPEEPPSDAEIVVSLRRAASDLDAAAAADRSATSPDARRLAVALRRLADGPQEIRARAHETLLPPLEVVLNQIRASLLAEPVSLDTLPPDLKSDWVAADGRARISVLPKGDSNDNKVLERFTRAVLKIEPKALGTPIAIQASGGAVVAAFVQAGVISFVIITLLLFLVLRRPKDVAVTMTPIVLTGLLTIGTTVILQHPLNFANIIAFPLLFGIGVAFHIYFVMAWRAGGSHLLQSSLAGAIFFSALTTATGFGSLSLSSHPGTASMGELLMISLIWTLYAALIFQPALMGVPHHAGDEQEVETA